ncbi:hypothetical protein ACHAW6_014652 [Cyclotella cf. meneghiniana]
MDNPRPSGHHGGTVALIKRTVDSNNGGTFPRQQQHRTRREQVHWKAFLLSAFCLLRWILFLPFFGGVDKMRSSSEVPPLFLGDANRLFDDSDVWREIDTWYTGTDEWVVTFVDHGYLEAFDVWLHYYRKSITSEKYGAVILFLVALTEEAYARLQYCMQDTPNVIVSLAPSSVRTRKVGNASIWRYRLDFLHKILSKYPTKNILFTDIDAYFMKNPFSEIIFKGNEIQSPLSNANIVASRGAFPQYCPLVQDSLRTGSMCMGFIRFRNTVETRTFVTNVIQRQGNDDQVAINCVIHEGGHYRYNLIDQHWPIPNDNTAVLRYQYETNETGATRTASTFTVALMSYDIAVRYCDVGKVSEFENINNTDPNFLKERLQNAVIRHCMASKNGDSKMEMANKMGMNVRNSGESRNTLSCAAEPVVVH